MAKEQKLELLLIAADNPIGKKQRRPIFRRKRAGEVLTREQVAAIKAGRKILRKQMKEQGLKEKSDFELTATNMGLYFDKGRFLLWLRWFFHGRGLWALLGALAALLATLFTYSTVTQMRGHFTINMTDAMFREGFILSETVGFENPVTYLFCTPAENVPCVSISHLPDDLDTIDGQHNADYFAYTFYCRNEGQSTVDYEWYMNLNSESLSLSDAVWVMIFEDGEMTFHAKANGETGEAEALPAYDDNSRGYIDRPMGQFAKLPEEQYETIAQTERYTYERVIPIPFLSDLTVAGGSQLSVAPGDTHKYTVVIWLEGDDPDCTNEKIGGHVGMDFLIQLVGENAQEEQDWWESLWDGLTFWDNPTPTDPE
ncbi:MAG: hypothetical protein IKC09_07300 [Oscillospiraceae bacterium]|nr:hypothetical protein [Oscillospiraceae bacterium]